MKFEHLTFTKEEAEKLNLKIMHHRTIFRILKKIHKENMKRKGYDYCPDAVYRDMTNRCIIFSNNTNDLIAKDNFDKMIKIYKVGKVNWPGDFKIKEFNPIMAMFMRNQVSEC